MKPLLYIGIPTLPERKEQSRVLVRKIFEQIDRVENGRELVAVFIDPRERRTAGGPTIAEKRRGMIKHAVQLGAKFVVQIDDDDDIADSFIADILDAIAGDEVACVSYDILVKHPDGREELAKVSNEFATWHNNIDPAQHDGYAYKQAPYFKVPVATTSAHLAMPAPKMIWTEDYDFMQRLCPYIFGEPEARINKVLYIYNAPNGNVDPNTRY